MDTRPYTALIRTRDSAPLVFRTIASLRAQSRPPASILAVDSGTGAAQLAPLEAAVDRLLDISAREFNYSRAINAGVEQCATPHVLIISSHVVLEDESVMERFLAELDARRIDVGFLISRPDAAWHCREVDASSFSGTNGLTNSCAFLPVALARAMPFREEVFSAEDQEWTARYLATAAGRLLGVETRRISYLNPRFSYAKKLNEELALAYYVDRRRMRAPAIGNWLLKALWSLFRRDLAKARFRMAVAHGLLMARRVAPSRSSKYF
jgi:hypothetical protein